MICELTLCFKIENFVILSESIPKIVFYIKDGNLSLC